MIPDQTLKQQLDQCKGEICDMCGALLDESQDFVLIGVGDKEEILLCLRCDEKVKEKGE